MKYFSEKWGKIDPVEYVLGTRFATRFIRRTGGYGQIIVKEIHLHTNPQDGEVYIPAP